MQPLKFASPETFPNNQDYNLEDKILIVKFAEEGAILWTIFMANLKTSN